MVLKYLFISMRPYQWIKNSLVFAALIFSLSFHEWNNIVKVTAAFIIFCLASSAVYLMNDLVDIKEDRVHPVKKMRPIASGKLNKYFVLSVMLVLFSGTLITGYFLSKSFAVALLFYIILNVCYSGGLKKVVILDVMLLSFGFLLRALAGANVIHVEASPWLFVCTLSLALLLGFGKRYNEIVTLSGDAERHRKNLKEYSESFLEKLMVITAATAIVTYSLYTLSNDTVNRINSSHLIYTSPMVFFGIFRYLYLVFGKGQGGDPTKIFLFDIQMIVNFILWTSTVIYILK
jgi:4-hydroxybenzoate polyprenyltransferase